MSSAEGTAQRTPRRQVQSSPSRGCNLGYTSSAKMVSAIPPKAMGNASSPGLRFRPPCFTGADANMGVTCAHVIWFLHNLVGASFDLLVLVVHEPQWMQFPGYQLIA